MNTLKNLLLISILAMGIPTMSFGQRLISVINNTHCNFEVIQFEYSVFNVTTQTPITNRWYPDAIHGPGISANGGIVTLPSDNNLLDRWDLNNGNVYSITIAHVWLWDIYTTGRTWDLLYMANTNTSATISTLCCVSGQINVTKQYPNPPSQDFSLVLNCSSPPDE